MVHREHLVKVSHPIVDAEDLVAVNLLLVDAVSLPLVDVVYLPLAVVVNSPLTYAEDSAAALEVSEARFRRPQATGIHLF